MTNLEQIVLQRLRWASGANPSIGEILNQFESRQKQRANEIEVRHSIEFRRIHCVSHRSRLISNSVHTLFKHFVRGLNLNRSNCKPNSFNVFEQQSTSSSRVKAKCEESEEFIVER